MRILHISDTHGSFPKLGENSNVKDNFDIVVHSGDFAPNCIGNSSEQKNFQLGWLKKQAPKMKKWLKGKPFFFVLGNHDFFRSEHMEQILKDHDIEAYDLIGKIVSYQYVNFYGFPFVPPINGNFNFELNIIEMSIKIDKMVEEINNKYVDVIVAHCPPAGILDFSYWQRRSFGNTAMTNALDYKISKDMMPQAFLCGHIHENHGFAIKNGVLFSNAATVQNYIEI